MALAWQRANARSMACRFPTPDLLFLLCQLSMISRLYL